MTLKVLDSRRRRLLLAVLLVLLATALLAWAKKGGSEPIDYPIDQVELQRSPTDSRVVRVLDAGTQQALACYQFDTALDATAAIAVGHDSQTWDTVAHLFIARLKTEAGQVLAPRVAIDLRLESYDGRLTVGLRLGTLSVLRRMSSQAEAERLSRLLQQGAWVGGRTTHLMEQPSDDQTYSLDLGTPLPDQDCPR